MKKSGFVNNFNCGANMLQIIFLSLAFLSEASLAVGKAKSMVYGETGRLDRFDPYTVHESSGHRLSDLLFDGLVAPGPGGSYKPALAQTWDVRKGGTEVLVTLREGVRWHRAGGGTGPSYKVSPADVIATLRLIKNEKSELPNKDRFTIISSAKKIGQNKILFKFNDYERLLKFDYFSIYHIYKFKQDSYAEYEELTDSYNVINLQLGVKFSSQFHCSLGLNNVFNETYAPHISRVRGVAGGVPNPGRFFNINLKYEF